MGDTDAGKLKIIHQMPLAVSVRQLVWFSCNLLQRNIRFAEDFIRKTSGRSNAQMFRLKDCASVSVTKEGARFSTFYSLLTTEINMKGFVRVMVYSHGESCGISQ